MRATACPARPPTRILSRFPITVGTMASIVSPKASAILTPIEDTPFYFNFGTGFHSNDAREAILSEAVVEQGLRVPCGEQRVLLRRQVAQVSGRDRVAESEVSVTLHQPRHQRHAPASITSAPAPSSWPRINPWTK
jgi:hypothetical protein